MKRQHSSKNILDFILNNVEKNPNTISNLVSKKYGVSRQSIHRYLQNLVKNGILKAEGNTRNRKYALQPIADKQFNFSILPDLEEDRFWRQNILPLLVDIKKNILDICHYGFTEMMNNVIEHSIGSLGAVVLTLYPNKIELKVVDNGVGIFKKIAKVFNLEDERHAVLELTKGKLTTDKAHHTGEGVFFTLRMFDEFSILSSSLFFSHTQGDEESWLIQREKDSQGTMVTMVISNNSSRTVNKVFNKYATADNDYSFSRTHVPVALVKYGEEQLVSRSQAKRLLSRLEPFKEVFLDFTGVDFIGQAFADEIFRVFKNEHPDIEIVWVNTSKEVENMIKRTITGSPGENQLKLKI
jgi:anti-sigma regulatory factor (Ser/Thr protein kinase)/predicted transcriptional regulator